MPVFTLLLMKRVLIADDLEEPRALYVTSLALAGLQVCRRLKANDRTAAIPIIILTGNTLPGVRETVERAGADTFLARPCSPETLVAAIQQRTGERAGGALPGPYPADDVSGGDPSREIEISRPARAADVLAGLAGPGTRFRRPRYTPWL